MREGRKARLPRCEPPGMTISIILGHRHGSDSVELVAGPSNPYEANAKFKELMQGDGDGFQEMYLHELQYNGGRKRATFPEKTDPKKQIREGDILGNLTIAELEKIADEEGIDVSECKVKKDFVEVIAAHHRKDAEKQPS